MNLKELSELLGISQTTVSRALNGYPEVSEVTRARVAEAARAHGYRPNARARGLATGHSRCIGHVISVSDSGEMVNPIFGDFMAGAGETYAAQGYDMMVKARGAVDGVVVHAPRRNDGRIALLTEIGLPFVVHGRASDTAVDYAWLDVNNRSAFHDITQHLIDLGHRRIGLINGPEMLDFAIRRRAGYEAALAAAGIDPDPDLMSRGEMTEAYGHDTAHAMLQRPDPPTAFVTSSIIAAVGVRRALDDLNLRLGDDVSVATFDDCLSYLRNGTDRPVFTAMQSSVRQAGSTLAHMLIDRVRQPDTPPQQTLWEAEFVTGPSTAPPKDR